MLAALPGRETLTYKKPVEYLQVTIDNRLSFRSHDDIKLRQARGVRARILPMISHTSSLSMRTDHTVYLLLLKIVITYVSPA